MRTPSNIAYINKQLQTCLLAPVSNTSRHTSSQKAHTLLALLTAQLLPWLSAALEWHQQSCAEHRVPSSHPNTQTHTWVGSAQGMPCHQTIFWIIVTSHHWNTPHAQRTCHNFGGKEEQTTQYSRTHIQAFSAPSMQYGKQRHHQVTFKVCALRGRPIKPSAKHYHSAITLFPVINCRSHSKAGTSYFHKPCTLGMQHVSALLLSTLSEAMQLQSSKLCPSAHPVASFCSWLSQVSQCYSYLPEFGTSVSRIKDSGVP